jgi:hypothetical protein
MTFFMTRSWRSSTAVSRSGLLIRLIQTAYAISTILFMDSSRRREPDTTASSPICRHWDSLRRSLTPPSSSFVVALRWCINYYMLMILPHNLLRCSLENHLNASAVVRHGPWPTSPLPGRHHGAAARGLVLAPTHLSQGHHRLHWHGRLQVVHLIKVVGGLWTARARCLSFQESGLCFAVPDITCLTQFNRCACACMTHVSLIWQPSSASCSTCRALWSWAFFADHPLSSSSFTLILTELVL